MGIFDTDTRDDVNHVAVTFLHSCLLAHYVSTQESMPILKPSTCSVS